MIALLAALGLGLSLGVVTGMPLGVVNVAVADAAAAGARRFAIGLGLGGALADGVHAAIAFLGIGQVITRRPEWTRPLAIASASLILAYVALAMLRRRTPDAGRRMPASPGVLVGLGLTLPNPGALAAWVAVASVLWPACPLGDALALAAGVAIGSALWFALLAVWISRAPRVGRIVGKAALVVLVAIAIAGVVRVVS